MTGPIIRPGSTAVNVVTGASEQDFIGIASDLDEDLDAAYARRRTRLYDIRDYGFSVAADMKAAITAARVAVQAASGGVVYIPGGTWEYAGWTEAEAGAAAATDNVLFVGDDKGTFLKLTAGAASGSVMLPLRGSRGSVEGIMFDTQLVASSTCLRVFSGSEAISVRHCAFDQPRTGGVYLNSGAISNVRISDNEFNGSYYGVLTRDDINLVGLTISGNTFYGGVGGDAIEINAPTGTAEDITITGNVIKNYPKQGSSDGLGIGVAHADRVTITGNTVTASGSDGIHIEDASHDITITGNTVSAAGRSGIAINYVLGGSGSSSRTAQVVIANNTVRGCCTVSGDGGIVTEGATGAATAADFIITGNIVRGNGRVTDATHGIMSGYQSHRATIALNHITNQNGGATASGVFVYESDALVTGNTIGDDQGVPTQKYGVRAVGGTAVARIRDNTFFGHVTADTSTASGGTVTNLG